MSVWLWYDGRLNGQEPLSCCKHIPVQDQKGVLTHSHICTHCDQNNGEDLGAGDRGEWANLTSPSADTQQPKGV